MQWEKFERFSATHLGLGPCLEEQLLRSGQDKKELRRVVERELDYVAVRPWESFDCRATGGYRLAADSETSVSYTVYAHVAGEDRFVGTRARTTRENKDGSVEQVIADLKRWHREYWAKQPDRPLVFDAVFRVSRMVHFADPFKYQYRKTLTIFLFPSDLTV